MRSVRTLALAAAFCCMASLAEARSSLVAFHQVSDELYRSGHLTEGAVRELADRGIRTIISLEDYDRRTADRERAWAEDAGLTFVWMPMIHGRQPTHAKIVQVLDAIRASTAPVLVHCKEGVDRTGIVAGAYRIVHQGWSAADAIDELRRLGHNHALYWWDDVLYEFE